jgi:hypothetical protein
MEAWRFMLAVLASSVSVGCLIAGGLSVWYGLRGRIEGEMDSLLLMGPIIFVPQSIIFGFYGCAEAWVFVGVVTVVSAILLCMRSVLESAH